MGTPQFKKKLLPGLIALSLSGLGAFAYAAEESEDNNEEAENTVTVTGIRGSLKQNINTKRFATAIVDAITAEDIGKFPDKNVSESLSRITGVGISREFGEGEKITIRGSGPKNNRILLNGQNVATADWFILDNPSRGFNFTLLPSFLVKNLEVYKSPQAKVDEGSIGGTVLLRTPRPLELDSNTVQINAQAQYSETSGKTDPQVDAMYSWRNNDDNFGFLVSASKHDRTVQREGLEILGWTPPDANGMRAPKDIGNPIFKQDRERETIFASFQFIPASSMDLTFNLLDSTMDNNNANANLLIRPQNNLADFTNTSAHGNNIYAATVASGGSYEWDFINRESRTETNSYDLDFNYDANGYSLHAQVGKTEAEGGTYNETSWSFVPNVDGGYSFDLSGTPTINIGVDPTDGSLWGQNWTWGGNKPTTDDETYLQLDLKFDVDYGVFTSIETGVKFRDHDRTQGRQAYSWHGPGTSPDANYDNYMAYIFAQCPTLDTCGQSSGTHSVASNVVNGNVVNQLMGNRNVFMQLGFGGNSDYAISNVLGEIWDINESISAWYIQGNLVGEGFRGDVGVRIVKTDQTSSSFNFSQDSWGFHTIDRDWLTPSYLEWVTEKRNYTEVLPSFNFVFDITDDVIIRAAAARTMARPNFADLAPIESTGDLNGAFPVGTAGNPLLKPQVSNQFDVTWEWYFNDDSILAVTYFYKDIQSYRTTGTFVAPRYNESQGQWVDVTFSRPENGLGGQTDGFEIGYQTNFDNFGVVANYTYTNANSDQERNSSLLGSALVEGASEHMFNGTLFFENETFGARLMYNYRSDWYKGVSWTGAELWNDSYGQLDFSASYNVSENMSLVFEAVNLTDEEIVEYDNVESRLMSIYRNGSRYVLGVNVSF